MDQTKPKSASECGGFWLFELDSQGEEALELLGSRAEWEKLFKRVRMGFESEPLSSGIRVRVAGLWLSTNLSDLVADAKGPQISLSLELPSSPDKVKTTPLSDRNLSSKALKLQKLLTQTPGLKRGTAMQKLALGAREFDSVVQEFGSSLAVVEIKGRRGPPGRRLFLQDPDSLLDQLELRLQFEPKGAPSSLVGTSGSTRKAKEVEAREEIDSLPLKAKEVYEDADRCGLQPKVFAVPSGRVLMVGEEVVWRETKPQEVRVPKALIDRQKKTASLISEPLSYRLDSEVECE